MRCIIDGCGAEAAAPIRVTSSGNMHEWLCSGCSGAFCKSPDFALVEQLADLGRRVDALSQYRNWKSTRERELARVRRAA